MHHYPFEAPGVRVEKLFGTVLRVRFTPAQGNTDISNYEAGHFRHYCEVKVGELELHCLIRGLPAGQEYRFYAQACTPTQECSYRSFTVGRT